MQAFSEKAKKVMYKFIGDENEIRAFYRKHIQSLHGKPFLSFLILPTARRKYFPKLSVSQNVIRSCAFPCNEKNNEDKFILLLKRLQIEEGSYTDGKGDKRVELPSEAFVIYLTVDPLNEIRGYNKFQKQMADKMERIVMSALDPKSLSSQAENSQVPTNLNIENDYKSALHACPEKMFKKLDVDTKDTDKIDKLKAMFSKNSIHPCLVVDTRGGYHVVINVKKLTGEAQKNLHIFAMDKDNKEWMSIEKSGCLVVIPGTIQAGYQTKMVDWIIPAFVDQKIL